MIPSADISFVVQGPWFEQNDGDRLNTRRSLESIRRFYPDCQIVFCPSGPAQLPDDIEQLADLLVHVEDAGSLVCGYLDGETITENVNRQIEGVRQGLARVTTKYAVKLRSDSVLSSDNLLTVIDRLEQSPAQRFERKVAVFNTYCRLCFIPQSFDMRYVAYHLSDFATVGRTEDVLSFWGGDLIAADERQFDADQPPPQIEQRLGYRFYSKFGLCDAVPEGRYQEQAVAEASIDQVLEDFVMLTGEDLGIQVPKRIDFSRTKKRIISETFIRHDWRDGAYQPRRRRASQWVFWLYSLQILNKRLKGKRS